METMINSKEVRWCWENEIFISPKIDEGGLFIEVYRIENGNLITLKRSDKKYSQKTKKDKDRLYEAILEGYKYYYKKFNKDENR